MLSYVLSFFRSPEVELSLEDATSILTLNQDQETQTLEEVSKPVNGFKSECNFATKIGEITGSNGSAFIIDSLYQFTPEDDLLKFQIGDRVSYQKLVSEGTKLNYLKP